MSDVAADALVDKGEILVEYGKPYGLNRTPNGNLASLGIIHKHYPWFKVRRWSCAIEWLDLNGCRPVGRIYEREVRFKICAKFLIDHTYFR